MLGSSFSESKKIAGIVLWRGAWIGGPSGLSSQRATAVHFSSLTWEGNWCKLTGTGSCEVGGYGLHAQKDVSHQSETAGTEQLVLCKTLCSYLLHKSNCKLAHVNLFVFLFASKSKDTKAERTLCLGPGWPKLSVHANTLLSLPPTLACNLDSADFPKHTHQFNHRILH